MGDPDRLAEAIVMRASQALASNTTFSSINRMAASSEKLSKGIDKLSADMEKSSASSELLARSLNRLTGALVLIALISAFIAGLALYFEYLKYIGGQT